MKTARRTFWSARIQQLPSPFWHAGKTYPTWKRLSSIHTKDCPLIIRTLWDGTRCDQMLNFLIMCISACVKANQYAPFSTKKGNLTGSWSYLDWFQLLRLGNAYKNNSSVIQRHRSMAINQCAKLIYTSGTTGNPKGLCIAILENYHFPFWVVNK